MKNRLELIHYESILLPKDAPANSSSPTLKNMFLRDTVTDVVYLYTQSRLGTSTMTPLLNPEGKPLLNSEFNFATKEIGPTQAFQPSLKSSTKNDAGFRWGD